MLIVFRQKESVVSVAPRWEYGQVWLVTRSIYDFIPTPIKRPEGMKKVEGGRKYKGKRKLKNFISLIMFDREDTLVALIGK